MQTPDWDRLEFPVSLRPVETRVGEETHTIPRKRSVFREDTEEVLDLVSSRYKLVPHGVIFRPLHAIVEQLPFPVISVRTEVGDGGGYAAVEWEFDRQVEVAPGDEVALSLRAKNSLNRTTALQAELSARRLVCSNGMRGPGPSFIRSWKHYDGSLDEDQVHESLQVLLGRADDMADVSRSWTKVKLFPQRFEEFLKEDGQASFLIGKAARAAILERLLRSRPAGRKTVSLWEAYNALTEHATHHLRTRKPDVLPARRDALHEVAVKFAQAVSEN